MYIYDIYHILCIEDINLITIQFHTSSLRILFEKQALPLSLSLSTGEKRKVISNPNMVFI